MIRARSLVFATFALAACQAFAQAKEPYNGTAVELARFAVEYERSTTSGYAMRDEVEDVGFYKGFVQGVFVTQQWKCGGNAVSMLQVWAVVAKYIREHPERWGQEARDLVIEAANSVWCHAGPTPGVGLMRK